MNDPQNELSIAALNEQGYLLQHRILDDLTTPDSYGTYPHRWELDAFELPVAVSEKRETRIDVVLKLTGPGTITHVWYAIIECKRSAPDYKRWIFFRTPEKARRQLGSTLFVARAALNGHWDHSTQPDPPLMHFVERIHVDAKEAPFDFGIEARLNPPNNKQRASATTAIEDALNQVSIGVAGTAGRLTVAKSTGFSLLPIIVTTADLFAASFAEDSISLTEGKVSAENTTLEPKRWLSINHRVSAGITENSGLTTHRSLDLGVDLMARQIRTVFVVQARYLRDFLTQIEPEVIKYARPLG